MFSIIKKGRQQAKDHSAKAAEKTKDEETKKPYRHVPTHAALDAMAGTPSSWRDEERPRILEQHRRRSAMGTNLVRTQGYPRDSTMSYVSYSSYNYSYSSTPALRPQSESRLGYCSYQSSLKGKEPEWIPPMVPGVAIPMTPSGRASVLSSRGTAQASSSSASVRSEDGIEMKSGKPIAKASPHVPPTSSFSRPIPSRTNSSDSGNLHHLHPAHQRKTSGSDRYYPPSAMSTRFTRPEPIDPRTIRDDASIPPVPSLPALNFDQKFDHAAAAHSDIKSASSVSSSSSARNSGSVRNSGSTAPSSILSKANQNSTTSFASLRPKPTDSIPTTSQPRQPVQAEPVSPVEARQSRPEQVSKPSRRRLSKSRRPSETEIDTHQWGQVAPSSAIPNIDAAATAIKPMDLLARTDSEHGGRNVVMPKITRRLSKTQQETPTTEVPQAVPKKKRWAFLGMKKTPSATA
ncbi:hypothetical protein PG993_003482 [Apiospora rasikravindrae]|uniref:Uncharacterized protein n=1 Tax=Apiospora rasikravindrae TaxID=990691 RepID=A0ABR1TZQ6_9PEZI